jgi:CHASE3 domain sensor protein
MNWPAWIGAVCTVVGVLLSITVAIFRVGAKAVESNAKLATSLDSLTDTVKEMNAEFNTFASSQQSYVLTLNGWRGSVDARLDGLQSSVKEIKQALYDGPERRHTARNRLGDTR